MYIIYNIRDIIFYVRILFEYIEFLPFGIPVRYYISSSQVKAESDEIIMESVGIYIPQNGNKKRIP